MKLFLAVLALPVLALAQLDSDFVNLAKCKATNPNLLNAIHNFCTGSNHITVPSNYAYNGATVGGQSAWITTLPSLHCQPEYVPESFCKSQMHHVCANGDKHGFGYAYYGATGKKCQVFMTNTHDAHFKVWN